MSTSSKHTSTHSFCCPSQILTLSYRWEFSHVSQKNSLTVSDVRRMLEILGIVMVLRGSSICASLKKTIRRSVDVDVVLLCQLIIFKMKCYLQTLMCCNKDFCLRPLLLGKSFLLWSQGIWKVHWHVTICDCSEWSRWHYIIGKLLSGKSMKGGRCSWASLFFNKTCFFLAH